MGVVCGKASAMPVVAGSRVATGAVTDAWQLEELTAITLRDARSDIDDGFIVHAGKDAFSYQDAGSMPASDLEAVKRCCRENGYGGFVVHQGTRTAYFRKHAPEDLLRNATDAPNILTLYVDAGIPVLGGMRMISYNLWWWNLFNKRGGNGGSAGKLVAAAQPEIIGFQECDDVDRVLRDGGLQHYTGIRGHRALAIAYKTSSWELLATGDEDVAEDKWWQYYGKRGVQWVRLRHVGTNKTVFFMNHHGPLSVNSGGKHGGKAVAENIMRVVAASREHGDTVIIVGDFNATPACSTIKELNGRIPLVYTGRSFGGVDNIFSTISPHQTLNLGAGGSDHDAVSAVFVL